MVLTAGVITSQSVGFNTAMLSATAASGGTGPYTQQWYRSTTTGFSPGSGNILAGQTGLTLSDTDLIPNTTYYYKVVYTDTGHSNDTVTATQLAITTLPESQDINQFEITPFLGMVDLKVGTTNVTAAAIASTQATPLYAGSFVNIANDSQGIPTVSGIAADTDNAWGVICYDIKSKQYNAGARAEIAQAGTCIWLYATTAIARGAQVSPDVTSQGAVQAATGSDAIVGVAFDSAAGYGQLIRVVLSTPSFLVN